MWPQVSQSFRLRLCWPRQSASSMGGWDVSDLTLAESCQERAPSWSRGHWNPRISKGCLMPFVQDSTIYPGQNLSSIYVHKRKNKGKTGKKPKFGHIPKVFLYDNLHKYFVLKVSLLLRGGLRGDWENFSNWLTWEESFFPVNYWETAKKTAITDAKKTV